MGKITRERQKFHIASSTNAPALKAIKQYEVPKYKPMPLAALSVSDNIFSGINIQLEKVNKFTETPKQLASTQSLINQKAAPVDEASIDRTKSGVIQSTNPADRQLTKKEKMKLKHEKLMQKIDVVQQAKQRLKEKRDKKKQKKQQSLLPTNPLTMIELPKPIKKRFSDLKTIEHALLSLDDSLPSLDSIFKMKSKDANTGLEQPQTLKSKKDKKNQRMTNDHKSPAAGQTIAKTITKEKKKSSKNAQNAKEFVKNYNLYRKLMTADVYKKDPRGTIALHIKNKLRNQK